MRVSALRSFPRGPERAGVEDPEEGGNKGQNRLVERARHRKQAKGCCASKRPGNLAVAREDGHGANSPADQSHAVEIPSVRRPRRHTGHGMDVTGHGMGVTERLARASSRHPRRVFLAWVGAIVVALVLSVLFLPGNLTTNGHVTGNPESKQAEDLVARFAYDRNAVDELVVVRSPTSTVSDPGFRSFLQKLDAQAKATGVVYRERPLGVSKDRHAVLIGIQRQEDVDKLLSLVQREDGRGGFQVVMTGEGTLDHDFNDLSQHDLKSGELQVGLPAALVVLILVFGSVLAGLVPLVMAIVAIIVALGLGSLFAAAFSLSVFFINMLTGMGLALGIDYSLFVVSRYREERGGGRDELAAISAAGATASRAVLFSGTVFVIALTGMLLVPSNVMKSLAVGAIAVGIVSVLAALTLLPALLGRIGDGINRLRVPWVGRSIDAAEEGRLWGAVVRGVMRRPLVSLVAFAALLIA